MKLTATAAYLASLASLVATLAVSSFSSTTAAATLTNGDRVARKVTVIMGATRTTHELKPGGLLKQLCKSRCIIRLDESRDKDFILDGSERVTIEDGLLYYDGEVAPNAQAKKATAGNK